MTAPIFPKGYSQIPAGIFQGKAIPSFGMKQTPVTNEEWRKPLGQARFILLHHEWDTGKTFIEKTGETLQKAGGPRSVPSELNFDHGELLQGHSDHRAANVTHILLKLADNPSSPYDAITGKTFSGPKQPVVGISWFHAKAWVLLKNLQVSGKYKYDLPTDTQYEAVASNFGKCSHGTEACSSLYKDGKKLAHINEKQNGTTVPVDHPKFQQNLPFGVQTTGNVWRWIRFNRQFTKTGTLSKGPYGLRGAAWDAPILGISLAILCRREIKEKP